MLNYCRLQKRIIKDFEFDLGPTDVLLDLINIPETIVPKEV